LLKTLAIAAGMAVTVYMAAKRLPPAAAVVMAVVSGGVFYALLLRLTRVLTSQDRERMLGVMRYVPRQASRVAQAGLEWLIPAPAREQEIRT